MIVKNCDLVTFSQKMQNKKLVCFGGGRFLNDICKEFRYLHIEELIDCIVDNNPELWGKTKLLNNTKVPILSPDFLYESVEGNLVLLISVGWGPLRSVFESLEQKQSLINTQTFIGMLLLETERDAAPYRVGKAPESKNIECIIPKVLNYAWFSGEDIPESYINNIETWKRYCPDFKIKQWNASNYDVNGHRFTHDTFNSKKWSALTDYVRLDVIYRHGGIFLDIDVELLKPVDTLLCNEAFTGFQDKNYVNVASFLGSVAHHPVIKILRDDYDSRSFIKSDGTFDMTTCPEIQTASLVKMGLRSSGEYQIINGMAIYPAVYFSPKNCRTKLSYIGEESYSIHHFDGSWASAEERHTEDTDRFFEWTGYLK